MLVFELRFSDLGFLQGNRDSLKNFAIFKNYLLPYKDVEISVKWVLLEDNASLYLAHVSSESTQSNFEPVRLFYSLSFDLNPITNV